MKYSLLAIKNKIHYPVEDEFNKLAEWLKRKTGIELEVWYLETDIDDLKYRVFKEVDGKKWFGLDGIKEILRKDSRILDYGYNGVVFMYDQNFAYDEKNLLGAWAYYNDLNGMEFMEVPATKEWEEIDNLYRILTHEILHAFHYDLWRKGINTNDTMDLYDKEYEVEAPDGNRARNIKELSPYFERVCEVPVRVTILTMLVDLYKKLIEAVTKKNTLELWIDAIQEKEGWFAPGQNQRYPSGSVSYRHNNPGNLRYSRYEIDNDGYSYFGSYETGRMALRYQLEIAACGESNVYKPTDTLFQFFEKYAPSSDDNDPGAYALFVAQKLNVPPTTEISKLI